MIFKWDKLTGLNKLLWNEPQIFNPLIPGGNRKVTHT